MNDFTLLIFVLFLVKLSLPPTMTLDSRTTRQNRIRHELPSVTHHSLRVHGHKYSLYRGAELDLAHRDIEGVILLSEPVLDHLDCDNR